MAKQKASTKKTNSTQTIKNSLLTALSEQFSTSINYVYINSLKREIPFREVTVLEQKTIAKLMIANEDKQNIVYSAQTALLQKICTDPTVNIEDLTEFDRIKLMLELYQSNFFKDNYNIECAVCGKNNEIVADFAEVINNFNKISLDDIVVNSDIPTHYIEYTLNFPTIKRITEYRNYQEKNKTANTNSELDYSVDMVDLFIKKLVLTNKSTNEIIELIPNDYSYEEYTSYLNVLPQSIVFNSSKLNDAIQNNIMNVFQDVLPKTKCAYCDSEIAIFNGINDFFTL